MADIWLLYSTFPGKGEAIFAASALVEKRFVACANVYDGVTSVYRWEGKAQQSPEAVLIAKTTKDGVTPALDAIKRLHPYDLPCIIAWPVSQGFPPFLEWVAEEVKGE